MAFIGVILYICEAPGDMTDTDKDSEVYISGKSHKCLDI